MTPLTLFVIIPAIFLLVCWVLYKSNHPTPVSKVETKPDLSAAAQDVIAALGETGISKKDAVVLVRQVLTVNPDGSAEELLRAAFRVVRRLPSQR